MIEQTIRRILPYPLQATLRLAQLRISDNIAYHEREDRRPFFYRAFNLLYKNAVTGDYAEFGCHGGMTFVLAYYHSQKFAHPARPRMLWAFDSFDGLPAQQCEKDSHPSWVQGDLRTTEPDFRRICANAHIPESAYRTVPGFYCDTIGNGAKNPPASLPDDIALAYIDCDLYSSTKSASEFLEPRLKHGMIIALDDFYLFSATAAAGERVALMEMMQSVSDRYSLLPFVQFGFGGMSFIVEDRQLLRADPLFPVSY